MSARQLDILISREREIDALLSRPDPRNSGVCWSGMDAAQPSRRTEQQLREAAESKAAWRVAWIASPQGQALQAVAGLQRACELALNLSETVRSAAARGDSPATCALLVRDLSRQLAAALGEARRLRRLTHD